MSLKSIFICSTCQFKTISTLDLDIELTQSDIILSTNMLANWHFGVIIKTSMSVT